MKTFNNISEKYYGFLFHYYRAEVYRETAWRNRLDNTTNWSIIVTAAMITFVFGNPGVPHFVIIVNYIAIWYFLYMEARRFRFYMSVKERTRLFEEHVLTPILTGDTNEEQIDWAKTLATRLTKHTVPLSRIESIAWRLRRNYFMIFPLLFLAWVAKVYSSAGIVYDFYDFTAKANILFIPGEFVFLSFLLVFLITMTMALYIPNKSTLDDLP